MKKEKPSREDEVRVYVDTDLVKGWYKKERSPGDHPGKENLVVFKDDKGNIVSSALMTSEEQRKMLLEQKFRR